MAEPAGGQLPAAADSFELRQLADGGVKRRPHPRFRNDLQGISPRSDSKYTTLWRDAPLYPRTGLLVRREHLRDSDLEPRARVREESLWHLAYLPRLLRPADHPVSAALHDPPAALLRKHRWLWRADRFCPGRV